MNSKWKGVLSGVVISLIITVIIILTSYCFRVSSWIFFFGGLFLGGAFAIYVVKLTKLKDTIIIGSSVGIISYILYYVGITIVFNILIPLFYKSQSNSNLPAPQAFLMAGINRYEPTIVDQLLNVRGVVLVGILFCTFSLLGSYSFYLISSLKKKEILKKNEILGYLVLIILLIGLILSTNFYMSTALGLILMIFTITFFIFIHRKEATSQ